MPYFIKTDKDPDGHLVCIKNGFVGTNGKYYLLLHRLPPEYAKPPTFLVELSADRVEHRGNGDAALYKAYAIQDLTEKERAFLAGREPGSEVLPFFNFSYPNVIKHLGKKFTTLTQAEIKNVALAHTWKLIGGMR